jgi:hypothetical protein
MSLPASAQINGIEKTKEKFRDALSMTKSDHETTIVANPVSTTHPYSHGGGTNALIASSAIPVHPIVIGVPQASALPANISTPIGPVPCPAAIMTQPKANITPASIARPSNRWGLFTFTGGPSAAEHLISSTVTVIQYL